MPSIRPCRTLIAAAMLGIAACSGEATPDSTAADSPRVSQAPGAASAPIGAATDAGDNGRWTIGSLEKRLDLQGMAPRRLPDTVQHAFLAVAGTAYRLGNAELQVFIYDDAGAVARDVRRLDTLTVSPANSPVHWTAKPTLITNSNLVAILLSENALQIERVQRALMAGTGSTVFDPAARPR